MGLLESLGYVVVNEADLAAWSGFATDLLGMQIAEREFGRPGAANGRTSPAPDVEPRPGPRTRYIFGWEVADSASMERRWRCKESRRQK